MTARGRPQKKTVTSVGKEAEKVKPSDIAGGNVNGAPSFLKNWFTVLCWYILVETSLADPQKLLLPLDAVYCRVCMCPRALEHRSA